MPSKTIIFFINLTLSLVILFFLSPNSQYISSAIWDFFNWLQKPISDLNVNPFDVIIISFIPVWAMPLYLSHNTTTITKIVAINFLVFTALALTTIICFAIGDIFAKPSSPLLPDYIVFVPFRHYLTFSLVVGIILTYSIFRFISTSTKNKDRHK